MCMFLSILLKFSVAKFEIHDFILSSKHNLFLRFATLHILQYWRTISTLGRSQEMVNLMENGYSRLTNRVFTTCSLEMDAYTQVVRMFVWYICSLETVVVQVVSSLHISALSAFTETICKIVVHCLFYRRGQTRTQLSICQ